MKNQTKIIIGIVVLVAMLVIASGSYAAYYFLIKDKENSTQSESITEKLGITEKNNIKEPEKITAEQKDEEEIIEEQEDASENPESEEKDIKKDSDNDGLTDTEEAIYGTDPNKKDTDGDGYSDYIEVKSGFDPLKKPEEEAKTDSTPPTTTPEDSDENNDDTTQAYPDPTNKMYVFFMHHSTGEIYWNGGLNQALADHNYVGYAPWWDGETDPPDFYNEFSNENKWNIITSENMPEGKTRDIVLFKSCFPSSDITSDEMLSDYKTYYKKLFEIYAAHPSVLFVPMSTPPLLKVNTSTEAAERAKQFETWLTVDYVADYEKYAQNNLTYNTKDYNIGGFKIPHGLFSLPKKNKQVSDAIAQNSNSGSNLAPFQLHFILADSSGYLATAYQSGTSDDHPNDKSGEVVGDAIWKHLNKAVTETGIIK